MRMAKAPQEHVDKLRIWMQFNNELMKIDPTYFREWEEFKNDWLEDENFNSIIQEIKMEDGSFSWEFYSSYYQENISHIWNRILFGFEVLLDNVCDPELDYLDFNKELKAMIKRAEENQEHKQDEQQ